MLIKNLNFIRCLRFCKNKSVISEICFLLGRWDPNDLNPKKWKANFRCALNSLQNVMEVKNLGESKGAHAYRVYQFLLEEETKPKDGNKTYSIIGGV